jgi:hypothetical protein
LDGSVERVHLSLGEEFANGEDMQQRQRVPTDRGDGEADYDRS